jgi:hypothetical protein
MSDRDRELRRWEWEREGTAHVVRANEHLRRRLHRSERQRRELKKINADLGSKLNVADTLLGEAMDRLLTKEAS